MQHLSLIVDKCPTWEEGSASELKLVCVRLFIYESLFAFALHIFQFEFAKKILEYIAC